ncbi:unnamed protein product [Pocillopora meandrina]|uniref:Uncharacterized protein n=1 Tax=Pocillopora meandrina TaxID=46732 RepID=A0AAU9XE12_9CNID|nr:unnamed protein product [Pocillopora meandrina]
MFTDNVKHVLWLDNSDTGDKFVFSEAYGDDRNSPYTIIDRVRGDNSDIDCDAELVEPEKLSDEDASYEPPKRMFVSTRSGCSATHLQLF